MRRYRRRYRRNSTNVVKMKFQSFMDISTDVDSMKIITISAGGKNIIDRCRAQFQAYKYYKLGNISVKLVPASTLPVDPTGLAYGVDQKVDPRDQLSPGLCRITNGEDIFEDISGLSDEYQHQIYNSMMLDPRWYKWMLQRGVKRHGSPRYWQIGQLHQDKWPGATVNRPYLHTDGTRVIGTSSITSAVQQGTGVIDAYGDSSPQGIFQTGHKGVLGWMPTDDLQPVVVKEEGSEVIKEIPMIASPVEVEMFKIILPKAYKTRFYYRAYISETVYFREPIVSFGIPVTSGGTTGSFQPLDVFHTIAYPEPNSPDTRVDDTLSDSDTGGNYGNN